MPVRACKVTVKDMDGVSHTVDVTAATLYEAVALGMAAIRTDEWTSGIAQGMNSVKVRVTNVPFDHEVLLKNFTKWLDRPEARRERFLIATGFGQPSGWRNQIVADTKGGAMSNLKIAFGSFWLGIIRTVTGSFGTTN